MVNLVEIRDLKVEATTDSGRKIEIIKGVSIDIAEGEITGIRSIVNPDKLAHLGEVGDVVAIIQSAR